MIKQVQERKTRGREREAALQSNKVRKKALITHSNITSHHKGSTSSTYIIFEKLCIPTNLIEHNISFAYYLKDR